MRAALPILLSVLLAVSTQANPLFPGGPENTIHPIIFPLVPATGYLGGPAQSPSPQPPNRNPHSRVPVVAGLILTEALTFSYLIHSHTSPHSPLRHLPSPYLDPSRGGVAWSLSF